MTDIVTYQAHITHGLKVAPWIAYVVLPDQSLWGVRFEGDTEEQAKGRAVAFYEAEKAKQERLRGSSEDTRNSDKDDENGYLGNRGRGQHLVGTVCMIHHTQRQRIRCKASEVSQYENKGWVKGGPRTQFQD